MEFAATFRSVLAQAGFPHLAERMLALAVPGVHVGTGHEEQRRERRPWLGLIRRPPRLVRQPHAVARGSSHLAGRPDVPADFEWPRHAGVPMEFVLQLRCDEAAPFAAVTLLPTEGMLWFLVAPKLRHGTVIFRRTASDLQPASAPAPRGRRDPGRPFPLRLRQIPTFPDGATQEFDDLGLGETEVEAFFDTLERCQRDCLGCPPAWGGRHQLGGSAECIQSDVRSEWEAAEARSTPPTAGRSPWRLLLQLDSDPFVGFHWGDAGRLYFGLREDDLLARRFEWTRFAFQCH